MNEASKHGRTVEEAVEAALRELGAERDMVEVEVLEGGSRGLFGLIGGLPAHVRVRVTAGKDRFAADFLSRLTALLDIDADVKVQGDAESVQAQIKGEGVAVLIGNHGQTLDALQVVTDAAVSRRTEDRRRLQVDVEGYRERRRRAVEDLARRAAQQARRTGRPIELEAMPAYERRFVHLAVQDVAEVETSSTGEEPNRRVVIRPKDEGQA
ncbi:MAG TPA: RNA-binding cell elongation regulator Jag/EloR [Bacillota bacterium]|nr:RNA-binding cell elongation regulator Jag/EloR [Bacillota bacterium]